MKKLLLFFLLLAVAVATKAQYTTGWDKAMNFGGAGADVEEMRYVNGDLYFFARMMGKYQFAGVTYDAGAVGSYPDQDLIFGKITSAGVQVLIQRFESAILSSISGSARIGADGGLYIFRLSYGTAQTFGSLTAPAKGLQLLKVGATGQFNWVKKLETFSDTEFGTSGVADPNFGGAQIKDNGEIYAIFKSNTLRGTVYPARVIKLDASGNEVWNYEMTATAAGTSTDGISISNMPRQFVDDNGNITFKIASTGTVSFNGETLPYEEPYSYAGFGNLKNWIISLDNTGAKKWSTSAYIEPVFYGVNPTTGEVYLNYSYSKQDPATPPVLAPFSTLPNLAPPPPLSYIKAVYAWNGIIALNTSGSIVKTRAFNYLAAEAYPTQMRIADNGRILLYSATANGNIFKTENNFVSFSASGFVAMEVDADFNPLTVFKLPAGSVVALNGNKFALGGSFKTALTIGSTNLTPNYIDTDFATRFPTWASIKSDVLIAEGNLDNMPTTPETTTWTGAVSTDWATAGNWTNGVPTNMMRAAFSGSPTNLPTIPNSSKAGQIYIPAGTELKLPASYGAFTVTDRVFNDGKITVENASFMNFFGASEIKGSGEFYFKGIASVFSFTGKIANTISFDNKLDMTGVTVNSLKFIGADAKFNGDVIVSSPAENAISGITVAGNFINGTLTRAVNPSGTYLFPVGTGSGSNERSSTVNYIPDNIVGTKSISVKYTTGTPANDSGGGSPDLVVNGSEVKSLLNGGFLTVLPNQQPSGGTYGLDFSVSGSSNTVVDPLKYVLIKRNNSSSPWIFQGSNTVAPTQTGSGTAAVVKVALSGINSFSDFAIGIGNSIVTLPVNLIKFTAKADSKSANLSWETASELSNHKFEIERSNNGVDFIKVGEVKGNGTSQKLNAYSFKDFLPQNGANYYRLKQIDYNGKFEYSNVQAVNFYFEDAMFSVYPNPATSILNFSTTVDNVELYNLQGVLLLAKNDAVSAIEIPNNIITGIYTLKLKLANGISLTKQVFINK